MKKRTIFESNRTLVLNESPHAYESDNDEEYLEIAQEIAATASQILGLKKDLRDKLTADIDNELILGKISPTGRDASILDLYSGKYLDLLAKVNKLRKEYLDANRPASAPKITELEKGHDPK